MAYPDNLLVQGERVIVNKRPHWKVLILPTILFIVIIAAGVALATWISKSNWDSPQWAYYADHRGGGRCVDHPGAGAVRPVADRALRHHQPPRVLPHRAALPPRTPDPAGPDREHGNRGHLLGPADGIRVADRRVVRRSAAQVPQCRVAVQGAGPAEPADPRRTGADPSRARPRAPGALSQQQGYQQPQGYQPGYPQQYVAPQQDYPAAGLPAPGLPAAGLSAAGVSAGGSATAGVPTHPGLSATARLPAARLPGASAVRRPPTHPPRRPPSRRRRPDRPGSTGRPPQQS